MMMHALQDFRAPQAARPPATVRLPTMYDLPSEDPEEPGLPDEFHLYQPQLLRETFAPRNFPPERVFTGADINLYYDRDHVHRYKRPDWFAALGVSRLYADYDLRMSYVVWDEGVAPYLVVELLSPGTEKEDLGRSPVRDANQPPGKWEVYEKYLQVPYYVVFSRHTDTLQAFRLEAGRYRELDLPERRIWLPEIELGLGLWQGAYQGAERLWLRWYDAAGRWVFTPLEAERRATEQERHAKEREQRAREQAEQRAEALAARLRELGIEP